jgi:hypothetical protein
VGCRSLGTTLTRGAITAFIRTREVRDADEQAANGSATILLPNSRIWGGTRHDTTASRKRKSPIGRDF